jgi:hypothetical protein
MLTEKLILITPFQKKYFRMRHSENTGGKAGKGNNKTRSFMLISEELIQFSGYISYTPGDIDSERKALSRASSWLQNQLIRAQQEGVLCDICGDPDCRSDHK